MRRSPGKSIAYLHDVVVMPEDDDEDAMGGSILRAELARSIEFGSHAINPGAVADLRRLAAASGLDSATLSGFGFETDDVESEELETTDG